MSEPKLRKGVILYVNPDGLSILKEDFTGRFFSFTFDKIKGYRGETVDELGLKKGSRVKFNAEGSLITKVELT